MTQERERERVNRDRDKDHQEREREREKGTRCQVPMTGQAQAKWGMICIMICADEHLGRTRAAAASARLPGGRGPGGDESSLLR